MDLFDREILIVLRDGNSKKFEEILQEGAGADERTLITRRGEIEFALVMVKSSENDCVMRPFLLYVGLDPRKRVVHDPVLECAEVATCLTCRDSKTIIENLTKTRISKHRILCYVQEIGTFMAKGRGEASVQKSHLLYKTPNLNCAHYRYLKETSKDQNIMTYVKRWSLR